MMLRLCSRLLALVLALGIYAALPTAANAGPYEDALAIPGRTVSFDKLDVIAQQDAYSSIHVVRNEFLVPDVHTTDTFKFSTPEVRFADRVVPLLSYRAFPLASLAPAPAKLETYLADFFQSLLSGSDGLEVAVKLTSAYEFSLVPGRSDVPRTVLPINLMPPRSTAGGSSPPKFVATVAADVMRWLSDHAPPKDRSGQISFALEVFAGGDMNQPLPLLKIENLYLPITDLPVE